ncbi:MAG TPA: sugar transferase [Conexibacter sp.]|nr:sugar transferase [Conexibacter sp.]
MPILVARMIRAATDRLPPEQRDRYGEEFHAELQALEGRPITTLVRAVRILRGASSLAQALDGDRAPAAASRRERCVAAFLLGGMGPAILLLAVVVKLTSPGPAFHRRTQLGANGREVGVLSFRTWTVGVQGLPCETRFGRLLREMGADRLPALVNAARGDISLRDALS